MEGKKLTTEEHDSFVNAVVFNIMLDKNDLLSEIDKMDSMLKEAEDEGGLFHLYDGKILYVVMRIAAHIDHVLSEIQKIGVKSLSVYDYLFYRDNMHRLYDIQERFTEVEFMTTPIDMRLPSKEYRDYSMIFDNIRTSDEGEQVNFDFEQLWDAICDIQNDMQTENARVRLAIRKVLAYVVSEMDKVIDYMTSFDDERAIIESGAKNYALDHYQSVLKSLKEQTSRLCEDCPFDLETEHWKKMKTTEDKALRYAIAGKLVDSQDESLVGYSESLRKDMEDNGKMISKLVESFPYNQLFDFDSLKGKFMGDLYVYLNHKNIYLFCLLVLRGNIIRCNCYRNNLKYDFDSWLKGEACVVETRSEELPESVYEVFCQPKVIEKYIRKMLQTFFNDKPKSMALIYCVLSDYGFLKNNGAYKRFVEALIEWRMINPVNVDNLSNQLGAYFRKRRSRSRIIEPLSSDFRRWKDTPDKRTCETIASVLDAAGGIFHYKYPN